jgi:hypothetical protein
MERAQPPSPSLGDDADYATPRKRRQRTYTIKQRREVLEQLPHGTVPSNVLAATALREKIPTKTLRDWIRKRAEITAFGGSEKRKTMGGQGRREMFASFGPELVTYMKDTRRDNEVSDMIHSRLDFTSS